LAPERSLVPWLGCRKIGRWPCFPFLKLACFKNDANANANANANSVKLEWSNFFRSALHC
jgi:hypothetical protein